MTHTKGPWRVDDRNLGCKDINAGNEYIATTAGRSPEKEDVANACLMAAAPELLQALFVAASALALAQDGRRPDYKDLETVLQAIAKAENTTVALIGRYNG